LAIAVVNNNFSADCIRMLKTSAKILQFRKTTDLEDIGGSSIDLCVEIMD